MEMSQITGDQERQQGHALELKEKVVEVAFVLFIIPLKDVKKGILVLGLMSKLAFTLLLYFICFSLFFSHFMLYLYLKKE